MANLQTRKQIAALIKRPPTFVGTYVRRGKIEEKNGKIDIDNPVNAQWVADFMVKPVSVKTAYTPTPKTKTAIRKKKTPAEDSPIDFEVLMQEDEIAVPKTIDGLKKLKEIKKIETETRLKNLELEKKKGQVLPLDFVIDWSGRNLRGIFGEAINFGFSMIEQLCFDLDADTETQLRFKKKFKQGLGEVIDKGIKDQMPEALQFAKEYALGTKW